MDSSSRLLKAFDFAWWSLGLLFIGVAVSRFVWPRKVVETPPPAFSKDVCSQNLRITVMESGQMPPDILRVRVKISTRTECKDEVQLALVAWLKDNTTDRMTDYHIEKSNLFSPISEQRELQMHVTEAFLRRAAPEHLVMLALVALPGRLTPTDWGKVTTVNQAVRNGGSVFAVALFQLRCKCPGKNACSISLKRSIVFRQGHDVTRQLISSLPSPFAHRALCARRHMPLLPATATGAVPAVQRFDG